MRRLPMLVFVAALFVGSACSKSTDIRTVADFDDHPCALFTNDALSRIVADPYEALAGVTPTLKGTQASKTGGETFACTYSFEAQGAEVPQVSTMTVTVAHMRKGSQPLAICMAGAMTNAAGYESEKIGDQACLSPSSDLWMKIGNEYFHVVVVPQPGFPNPVDAHFALSPVILAVATAAADRMPKT